MASTLPILSLSVSAVDTQMANAHCKPARIFCFLPNPAFTITSGMSHSNAGDVVLKKEVWGRTQKTSPFEQHFKLIFKSVFH